LAAVPVVLFFEKRKVAKRLNSALGAGLQEKQLTDFIYVGSTRIGSPTDNVFGRP
jgi:hypothetical protein